MLSWLSPLWTIGAFDSAVHMSEEAANAKKAVPYGIILSIGSCWVLGFIIMIVIAACISPDLSAVATTSFGQPMAQVCKLIPKIASSVFAKLLFQELIPYYLP